MSSPSYETKVRPSAGWYALVAALWIAAVVAFVLLFVKPLVGVLDTDLTAFANGDPVSIGSDGLSVYAEDDDALGACTLTADDGSTFQMDTLDLSTDFEVETTGPTLAPFASTPDDLPAGTYAIDCTGGDTTVLATGNRIDEDSLYTQIGIGTIISLMFGVLGLALLIVLLVRRHNSKTRIRTAQAAAYYGAWPQPQQGYDPYAQQQQQGYDPYAQQHPGYDPYAQQQQGYDPYAQQQQGYNYGQQPPQPGQPGQPPQPGQPAAPDQGYGTQQGYQAPQQPDPYAQQPQQPAPTNEPYGGYAAPTPQAPAEDGPTTPDRDAPPAPDSSGSSGEPDSSDPGSSDPPSSDPDNR